MPRPHSAGILLYRLDQGELEVLLVHPGGPFWKSRDVGAWMIPKGGIGEGESAQQAAVREFQEEVGATIEGELLHLARIRQSGGKVVEVFAAEGDFDPAALKSVEFEMEWPPRSGRRQCYPECDSARWMGLGEAARMILPSQLPLLDALRQHIGSP